ncbi:MAG: ribosome maturation factor RimP, partial [[Eubacterium] sulci]|nr:ribosome maturation factor RimP [[Eubacterium] sulci]
ITQEHFDRYVGSEIEIKLYKAIDKKKQLVGTLVSLNDGIVKITVDGKDMELPRDQIAKANLAVIF